jgi:phosphoglycerate dehydrogenase-like enzyme
VIAASEQPRLLLSGRLAKDVQVELGHAEPSLGMRVVPEGAVRDRDAAWATAYCGFSVPPNLVDSDISWFHAMSAGLDGVQALLPESILLTRTVGEMPRRMADYVLAAAMGDRVRLLEYADSRSDRLWDPRPWRQLGGLAIVLGAGPMGGAITEALGPHFDVLTVGRTSRSSDGLRVVDLDEARGALPAADLLVCALPLTSSTRGLVGADLLGRLEDALLISVGRGACVDEGSLRGALDRGSLRWAVLDVFEQEPLPGDSWLWDHPQVTITPHISAPTTATDVARDLTELLSALRVGAPLPPRLVGRQ